MTQHILEQEHFVPDDFDDYIIDLIHFREQLKFGSQEYLKDKFNASHHAKIKNLYIESISFIEELTQLNHEHLEFFKKFLTQLNTMRDDSKYVESIFEDSNKMVTSSQLTTLKTEYKNLENQLFPLIESLFYSTMAIFNKNHKICENYRFKNIPPAEMILSLQNFIKNGKEIANEIVEDMAFFNKNLQLFIELRKKFNQIKEQIVTAAKAD